MSAAWTNTPRKEADAELLDISASSRRVHDTSKTIKIRNVPDKLHRKLKARAALSGMSLSEYLLAEMRVAAERPTVPEIFDRLRSRPPVIPDIPFADMVREEREAG